MTSSSNSQSRWRTSRRKTKVAGYASYLSPIWCEDYVWSPGVFIICGRKCFQLDGLFIFSNGLQIWTCSNVGVWPGRLRQGRRAAHFHSSRTLKQQILSHQSIWDTEHQWFSIVHYQRRREKSKNKTHHRCKLISQDHEYECADNTTRIKTKRSHSEI